ncbi:MAG TPA: polysaccharide biosynthesis tyrosine autokinase [Chitinophagaceae bacterium]|jgi:capsular exopolysaccharide synthesis family protein|nr:polysaccharide biosynthesis tyrosine autokinase [Chitinophagaceae bacterium]
MNEQVNSHKSELWNLSLRDLFYKYVRFLPIFILSVAFALFAAYAYLRYATPIYNISGTMYIKSDKAGARSDKFEDIFVNDKAQNIQSEIEILKSKPLMERVVKGLGLQFNYFAVGKVKKPNIYKQGPFLIKAYEILDSLHPFELKIKFTGNSKFTVNDSPQEVTFGQGFKTPNGLFALIRTSGAISKEYRVNWVPTSSMAAGLAGSLQVTPKTLGTGILNISMMTPNSQLGADVINRLMEEYNAYTIEEKKSSSDSILKFIDGRLAEYGTQLDSAKADLLRYQQQNNLIDVEAQFGSYFASISEADKAIDIQVQKVRMADLVGNYLSDKRNEYNQSIVPSSLGLEDLTLNELVTGYNTIQLERQGLIGGNTPPNHPSVLALNEQLEKVRTSILENIKNLKGSYTSIITELRGRSGVAQGLVREMPYKVTEFMERKRRVESIENLYKYLQEKREETSISRASTIASAKVVDRAFATSSPVKPNRRAIQILAILLGLGLPAMIIFIGEVLNDKVSTRFDIEKITAAPILGEVGHSYSEKVLIVNKTTRSMVAEQFRIIRSNLQYIVSKEDKQTILVTSSFSGEGKSFVSTNMGAVLALAGKRTVILEFDIRKPKVLSGLAMPKGQGITNFLVGKVDDLNSVIRPVAGHDNLFVLGCGPIPPNPSELLLDKRVEEMFAWLKSNFDVVIVDTAPVGMVSDAMTLGKYTDCTLYLVRQGHTFKKQVALIDEFYKDNKLPKVSIIINDVKMKPGYGYYGYGRYGYGYGYGYGSYYEEEHPPKTFLDRLMNAIDFRKWFKKKK